MFHEIPFTRSGINPLSELSLLYKLYRLYRQIRPDLVHHVTIKPVLYGSIAARMASVPAVVNAISGLGYVFSAPGVMPGLLRLPVKALYKAALAHKESRVIVQNIHDYNVVLNSGWADRDRIRLIRGSGVDLSIFKPVSAPPDDMIVVLASRMLWDKGVGLFIEAARHLLQQNVSARFVLVGNPDFGNPNSVTEQQLLEWDDEPGIEWWGFRDHMERVFDKASIVCLPTYYGEGVPKVLIEAAASGKPVVATDIPGCAEIIKHDINGILVPTKDAEALSKALALLINNKELRLMMGLNGRRIAENEFSIESVIKQTMDIYQELLV
jgi:glycosyltransferase involved in cell wall biosynthesis